MTVLPTCDTSFDLESCNSDCDSGNISDDFPYTQEEVQEIYDELDLDEEGITEEEITRRKRRIFVGGLKFASEDNVLHEYFQQFGKIREAAVIKDRKNGLSKGYGFVTMVCDTSALRAIVDKSPKLDGRRCNVNLAFIGQKKKPPSKKPDLKLKDLSPLQGQVFNYNANGYVVSPTVLTPNGYYQLGLPPLHGHQPIYHIPQSPQPCYDRYEPDTTYLGTNCLQPPSPMSPMYQQPIYYTQPVLISSHPMHSYPPQQQQQSPFQQVGGSPNEVDNNGNTIISISTCAQNSPVDANNNISFIPPNHTATTNVVPSTYGLGSIQPHQGARTFVPVATTTESGANTPNLMGASLSYAQGMPNEVRPFTMKGKSNRLSSPLPQQIHHNSNTSHSGNLIINGTPLVHNGPTQLMGVHPPLHNGESTTTYVTSAPMQNQSQNQPMYTIHQSPSGPHFVQHMSNQPREIVQI